MTTYCVKREGVPIEFSSDLSDAEAIDACRRSDQDYGKSLAAWSDEKGWLSASQLAWCHKIAVDQLRREQAPVDSKRVTLEPIVAWFTETGCTVLTIAGLRITIAGRKARYPESLTVTTAGRASRKWLGRIHTDGQAELHDEEALSKLVKIACNPALAISVHGRREGRCACCGKKLRSKASLSRGYGPECAKRYNLPMTSQPRKDRG